MMPSNDLVADSSFMFSLFNPATLQHEQVNRITQQIRGNLIVPQVILTEVAYLFKRYGGVPAVSSFLTQFVASQPTLVPVTPADLIRARDIMNAYPEAELDFVDCCIAAIAERLNITQIATLDQRDFSIIRPKHTAHFELLPSS